MSASLAPPSAEGPSSQATPTERISKKRPLNTLIGALVALVEGPVKQELVAEDEITLSARIQRKRAAYLTGTRDIGYLTFSAVYEHLGRV